MEFFSSETYDNINREKKEDRMKLYVLFEEINKSLIGIFDDLEKILKYIDENPDQQYSVVEKELNIVNKEPIFKLHMKFDIASHKLIQIYK